MATNKVFRTSALLALLAAVVPAHAASLADDWSDLHNPDGPWSYRVGTTVLPHTDNWTAGIAFPAVQPAYLPANVAGDFLPAWFKAQSVPDGFDMKIGDVVVHTNDNSNGNEGLGVANILFVAPTTGTYSISGGLWNASTALVCCDFAKRPQDWTLLVNGVSMASGVLSDVPGEFTRAGQQTFAFSAVPLAAGDSVQLNIFRDTAARAGFFVGTELSIQAVPEPSTVILFSMSGILGLGLRKIQCAKGSGRRDLIDGHL